jgi:HPt (histidine-containing phosphotransfer) domain-containing protein
MKRKLVCYYDNEQYYNLNRLSNIVLKNEEYSLKYIYAILNSSLLDFYFNIYFNEYEVKPLHLSKLPIKKTERQLEFAGKSDIILELYKTFQSKVEKFIARLNDNFSIPKINRKIEAFYDFDFKTFINELKKQKINLTLVQQDEWEEYFNLYKDEINQLQSEINKTDQEIDQMVHELYGLTEEEIKIVEESI